MNKATLCIMLVCVFFATTSFAETLKDAQGDVDALVKQGRALLQDDGDIFCDNDSECGVDSSCLVNICVDDVVDMAKPYLGSAGSRSFITAGAATAALAGGVAILGGFV